VTNINPLFLWENKEPILSYKFSER